MNFTDKVVWITGASSGIGQELSKQLAQRGARIVLSSRRNNILEKVRDQLPGGKSRHWLAHLDLSDSEALFAQAPSLLAEFGKIDILINNGGISQRSLFLETDFSVYRRLMEVNYLGTIALTKIVLPGMVERRSGSVVSISSVAGKVGSKLRSGYSGSKYAVVGFMDCLRAETKQHGIHCLTVCPGFIKTDIDVNSLNAKGKPQQHRDDATENGMAVDICCKRIIKAIEQRQDEVIIGQGISALAPTIKRFLPSFFNYLSARKEYR
ncbi:MAG: SDR family oxidoreductase [Pseudomonadota bacterium]|nr:SDR family oxidoreductase [Pseudomonadota bacterium]